MFSTSHTSNTSIVRFESVVEFDGWYMVTKGDPARDSTSYKVHVSVDGSTWEQIASAENQAPPEERDAEIRFSFVSLSYLWPYYLIIASFASTGVVLTLFLLLPCIISVPTMVQWHDAPVRIFGWCHILKGVLIWISLGFLTLENRRLPLGPIKIDWGSLAFLASLEIALWPGPLAFTQSNALERAFVWGVLNIGEYSVHRSVSSTGEYAVIGPMHIICSGALLYFRWKRRRDGADSVQRDKELFDKAWVCILEDPDAKPAKALLKAFEQEILISIGISQERPEQMLHVPPAGRVAEHRPVLRSADHETKSVIELKAGNIHPAKGRPALSTTRIKLFLEQFSHLLSSALNKVFEKSRPVMSLDQLYCQAVVMEPIFRVQIQHLALNSAGHFYVSNSQAGDLPKLMLWSEIEQDESALSRVCWPAIKHMDQAIQKVSLCYHGKISRLRVVRQRIVFNSLSDIYQCLDTIRSSPDLKVVRVKNRFDASSDVHRTAGYRDVMVVLNVVTPATTIFGVSGHCCELQLSHRRMATLITPEQHTRYLTYKQVVVPFEKTGWIEMKTKTIKRIQRLVALGCKSGHKIVAGDDVLDKERWSVLSGALCLPETMPNEGVDPHLEILDPAGVELQETLTVRLYEVLRWLCHVEGGMLHSSLKDATKLGVSTADVGTVFFVRPLGALLQWPFAALMFLAGSFFFYSYWSSLMSLRQERGYNIRHVRFSTLERRDAPLNAVADVDVKIFLLHGNMCEITSKGLSFNISGTSLFLSVPSVTTMTGWSMTSSHEAGSEHLDPVRFELSIATISKGRSLSDCMLGNSWSTAEQIQTMSAEVQRTRIVSELSKVPGSLCAEVEDETDVSRCRQLGDDDLVLHCLPAHSVREDEWVVVSASQCRVDASSVDCKPRPSSKFAYFSLQRGFTHSWDLRPPWYLVLGVVHSFIPMVFASFLASFSSFLGYLWPTRIAAGALMFIPGVMELMTAVALTTAERTASSNINPLDSLYWWVIAFTSMLMGLAPLWDEKLHLKTVKLMMPLWFLVTFPAINIHYAYNIEEQIVVQVPPRSAFVFVLWVIYMICRQLVFHKAKRDVAMDMARYDDEWNKVSNDVDQATVIRGLEDTTARYSSKTLPVQLMSPLAPHLVTITSDGRWTSSDTRDSEIPSFLPQDLRNPRAESVFSRILKTGYGVWGFVPNNAAANHCHSLDTLYMQAYLLEPIFNQKVQQIAVLAHGALLAPKGFLPDTFSELAYPFVAGEEWDPKRTVLKSVDRSIEKISRCYQGNVALLVDVCRACMVLEDMDHIHKAMSLIADDPQLQIVRVKNRFSRDYKSTQSAGYRDVLVNLRISNTLTQKFGLELHVCELQLSLKQFMILRNGEGHKRYVEYRNKRCE